MSTEDSMRKVTENLDKAAEAAPSSNPVDVERFGTKDDDDLGRRGDQHGEEDSEAQPDDADSAGASGDVPSANDD